MTFLYLLLALFVGCGFSANVESIHNKDQRADFSKTIFIGDQFFKLWLSNTSPGNLRGSRSLVNQDEFLRTPSILKGECSDAASQWYCNTLFYKAFPKALNIGQSGWTTEDWMTSLKSGHPLITRLTEMAYHNHVVIEVGGGLVMDMLRENEEKETEEGVRHVQAMAPLLQKALPHCEISFFSVLPDSFSEEKSLESIGVHRVTDMDPFAEGVLHASFYNITPFHVSAIQKR